ncbi:MAG: heme exporter protein CcmB [Gammaproteobacteria bacterium]|nr:heme exporter protein CcmB [Gammaproteobacteria bacterium]
MIKSSLARVFFALLKRDLLLAFRHRSELFNPLLFFVLVVTLFPLGTGADTKLLQAIAPGIIWVAALLAAMLSLDTIFRSDFEDGSLELLLLNPHPTSILVLAKVLAHWLITGLPLMIIAPLLALFLGMDQELIGLLVVTLFLGTPVLSLIGAVAIALTVGLKRGGILLSLLVLPFYVPVLIFATNAIEMAMSGLPVTAQLWILGSFLLLAITLTPWPTAAALKLSLS